MMWLFIFFGILFIFVDIIFRGLGEMIVNLFVFMMFLIVIEIIKIFCFFIVLIVVESFFLFVLELLFVIIIRVFLVVGFFFDLLKILKVFCNVFFRIGFFVNVDCVLMVDFSWLLVGGKELLKVIICLMWLLYIMILYWIWLVLYLLMNVLSVFCMNV